jgi:hypothetical protein
MAESERTPQKLDLVIPIYLDINALLDLLASVENGFAVAEKITSRSVTADAKESSIGTEFGIANILNLLKIGLGGSLSKKQVGESGTERSLERYHTYGSLLHRLRSALIDMNLLKPFAQGPHDWTKVKASDFVELQGIFRPNPLVESFSTIERLMDLVLLSDRSQLQGPITSKSERKQASGEIRKSEQTRKFLSGIRSSLEQADIRVFIVDLADNSGYKAVVSLFNEYLRDRSMTELTRGEFRLLGKISRNTPSEGEAVDLLRGTAFGGLSDAIVGQMLGGFGEAKAQGLNLPQVETKVRAPALQVIPIAIYV